MITVVIPTHNRCETLKKAIAAYQQQSAASEMSEVIVVDDGSTDATGETVAELSKDPVVSIRYFRQENSGPAAARNVGIREAKSPLILFTDDDIIPCSQLVAEHSRWHARYPDETIAILGHVTWSPEVNPTPFMQWYGSDGPLFAYSHFKDRVQIDYTYFYTCNVSLKTQFLRNNGTFDEDFKTAAYEDIELGYRLAGSGMRLLHNPQALAFHCQYVSFEDACRRAKKAAVAAELFRKKEAGRALPILRNSPLRRFRKPIASALSPLKGLMDCRFPLPRGIYRTMLRIYR